MKSKSIIIICGAFLSILIFIFWKLRKKGKAQTQVEVLSKLSDISSPEEYNRTTGRTPKDVLSVQSNNPGAIFHFAKNDWIGLDKIKSVEGKIAYFKNIECGIRAQLITLKNYQKIHGLKTTTAILNRYAPANVHNNNTQNYIDFVSKFMKVDSNKVLDFEDTEILAQFGYAQHIVEAGFSWVPYDKYLQIAVTI